MREPSEIWEPDAVTPHVRICEGPRVNWKRLKSCDTTTGNQWTTGNTNLNLNPKDLGLLTQSREGGRNQLENHLSRPVILDVRR